MKKSVPEISYLEYRKLTKNKDGKPKNDRYGGRAKRTTAPDGKTFASMIECTLYCQRLAAIDRGEAAGPLVCQPRVRLGPDRFYKPDFSDMNATLGMQQWHESKGNYEDYRYRDNKKLWLKYGPGPLIVWKGTAKKMSPAEFIYPNTWTEDEKKEYEETI